MANTDQGSYEGNLQDSQWRAELISGMVWMEQVLPATQSGYKLHVYGESRADVERILALTRGLATSLGLGLKAAGPALFRDGSSPQRNKAVTFYLPRRATVQRDAEAIVDALAGYGKDGLIPQDQPLGNGVHWRFEFGADPGRDLTTAQAQRMYAPARDALPLSRTVRPLTPPVEIRIRDTQSRSVGAAPLALLKQQEEAIARVVCGTQGIPITALYGVRLAIREKLNAAMEAPAADVAVAQLLGWLGFSADARIHSSDGSPAGVKITGITKSNAMNHVVLTALSPVALPTIFVVVSGSGPEKWQLNMGQEAGLAVSKMTAPATGMPEMATRPGVVSLGKVHRPLLPLQPGHSGAARLNPVRHRDRDREMGR